jgi:hypothetical protein
MGLPCFIVEWLSTPALAARIIPHLRKLISVANVNVHEEVRTRNVFEVHFGSSKIASSPALTIENPMIKTMTGASDEWFPEASAYISVPSADLTNRDSRDTCAIAGRKRGRGEGEKPSI